MKSLVVYYSMSGNCEMVAEKIKELAGADVLRIEPEKAFPDSGFKKFFWGGKSAVMGDTPALKDYSFDASLYDIVVIGFPVWASRMAPPLKTFVADNLEALKGKKVASFACQGGSGAEKAFKQLCGMLGRDSLDATLVLNDPKTRENPENEKTISAFCDKLR